MLHNCSYMERTTHMNYFSIPEEILNNRQRGKAHNSHSRKCQTGQPRSLLHFAYHYIETANSLLPVHLQLMHCLIFKFHLSFFIIEFWMTYLNQFKLISFKIPLIHSEINSYSIISKDQPKRKHLLVKILEYTHFICEI